MSSFTTILDLFKERLFINKSYRLQEVYIVSSLILVINCGSSSIKFAVMEPCQDAPILSGLAECIGLDDARITFKSPHADKKTIELTTGDHKDALNVLVEELRSRQFIDSIGAIGHRVAQGGSVFSESALLTPTTIAQIEELAALAPLHNPANLSGIRCALEVFPQLKQVAVFDTSFHQTLAPAAYTYAVPHKYLKENNVRRFGFHGTSHKYVASEAVKTLGLDPNNHGLVIAHLGNGSSVCAVKNGISVDTSMGMTPLEGLVMGTRSGDIDFAAAAYIGKITNKTLAEVEQMLNKESGLLGVSELSSDCRTLESARNEGHAGAILAIDVFVHRLARHIGAHAMSLDHLDAIIFTGGIGENSSLIRELTLKHLKVLGFELDSQKNNEIFAGKSGVISCGKGPVAAVITTNEEKMIALDTDRIVKQTKTA